MEEAGTAIFNSAHDGGRSDRLSVVRGGPHALHHFFATRLFEARYDIRTIQGRLGHKDGSTTMIYAQVLNRGGKRVKSPGGNL